MHTSRVRAEPPPAGRRGLPASGCRRVAGIGRVAGMLLILSPWPRAAAGADPPAATQPDPQATVLAELRPAPMMLVRDAAVRAELGLTDEQASRIDRLMDAVDETLWPLRDRPADACRGTLDMLKGRADADLKQILRPGQRSRLHQIALRAEGLSGLQRPSVRSRLKLGPGQVEQIDAIARNLQAARQQSAGAEPDPAARRRLQQEEERLAARLEAVLDDGQKRAWGVLVGRPFDFSRLEPPPFKAPELRDVTGWIHSGPLTLAGLRGRVVVLHFYTFGCINCIHNFPAYRRWQEAFAGKEVTILGIHAPETSGERDVESVRRKADEAGLRFPIAVDNQLANWRAWGNGVWPAVYVIDRRGRVRCWWYGELNWKDAGGESFLAGRIDALLAEPRPEPRALARRGDPPASAPAGR